MWSSSLGSSTELQLAYPTALISCAVTMGKHASFVPSQQWVHQTIDDIDGSAESGSDFFSLVAAVWLH